MILKILKLHSPKGSCNFENFQNHSYLLITNCTRGRAISYTNYFELGKNSKKNFIPYFGIEQFSFDEYGPLYNKLSALNRRILSVMKLSQTQRRIIWECGHLWTRIHWEIFWRYLEISGNTVKFPRSQWKLNATKRKLFSSRTFHNLMIASLCSFLSLFIALNCKLQNVLSCSLWEFLSRISFSVKRLRQCQRIVIDEIRFQNT